jgi:hypothetical protein
MMASIRRWLHQRFRLIALIPLLLVLVGIGVQALAGIGSMDSYMLQCIGWVIYLMAVVGLVESGTDARSRRASRGRGQGRTSDGSTGHGKRTNRKGAADRPRGAGRTDGRGTGADAGRGDREPPAKPHQRTAQSRRPDRTVHDRH